MNLLHRQYDNVHSRTLVKCTEGPVYATHVLPGIDLGQRKMASQRKDPGYEAGS